MVVLEFRVPAVRDMSDHDALLANASRPHSGENTLGPSLTRSPPAFVVNSNAVWICKAAAPRS